MGSASVLLAYVKTVSFTVIYSSVAYYIPGAILKRILNVMLLD